MTSVTVNLTPTDIETFTQYFKDQDIAIKGTFEKPLFKLTDVAKKIDDTDNYKSKTKDYDNTLLIKEISVGGKETKYLTEYGLYEYLLTSTRPKANEFRCMVKRILIQMKEQLIDNNEFYKKLVSSLCEFDEDNITPDIRVDRAIAKFIKDYPTSLRHVVNLTQEDKNKLKQLSEIGDSCIHSGIFNLILPKWTPPKVSYKLPDWM